MLSLTAASASASTTAEGSSSSVASAYEQSSPPKFAQLGLFAADLEQPGALYVGQSAGSIVAGTSVSTAFWKGWDDPAAAPDTDWTDPENLVGMSLVDRSFFPHYNASYAGLVEERRSSLGHPVECLEDAGPAFAVGDAPDRVELRT